MFGYKTEEVLETLAKSIDSAGNIMLYIENPIVPRSDIINRLFNVFKEGYKTRTSIVSQYAANEIALKSGTELVENLYKALKMKQILQWKVEC